MLSDFCYPDILKTQQQSTPKSGNLKWINHSYKLKKKKSRVWEIQDGCLAFSQLLDKPHFLSEGLKPSLVSGLMSSQWKRKGYIILYSHLEYNFYNLQWSRHPLNWTNHRNLKKKCTNFLKLSLSLRSSIIRHGQCHWWKIGLKQNKD